MHPIRNPSTTIQARENTAFTQVLLARESSKQKAAGPENMSMTKNDRSFDSLLGVRELGVAAS